MSKIYHATQDWVKEELNFKLYGTTDVYTLTEDDINIDNNGRFCSQKYEEIVHDVIIIPEGITEIKPLPLEWNSDMYGWPEGEYAINLRSKKTICPSTLTSLITVCDPEAYLYEIESLGDNVILNEGLKTLNLGEYEGVLGRNVLGDLIIPTTVEKLNAYGLEDTLVLPKDMEKIILDIIYPIGGKVYVYNPEMDFSNVSCEIALGDTFTIYGYLGSTAYNYAKEHDIKFIDIENDSSIILNGLNFDSMAIRPNEYYTFKEISSLTIDLSYYGSDYTLDEYMFSFETPEIVDNSFLQITSYKEIKWVKEPNLKPNYIYEVSIVNHVGVIAGIPKEVA